MREEFLRTEIEGHLLHRLIIHPAEGVDVSAVAIFYHGQGDYAERYLDILHPFVDRGVRCIITELPGHGHSPGVRGHCGDAHLLDAVIQSALKHVSDSAGLPYGVMGHSMGGLLAARHLVLAGQGSLPVPDFAWLSSPLVDPSRGRHPVFLRAARLLSPIVPALTFSTHVKPENFTSSAAEESPRVELPVVDECITRSKLWHNRVSLGWGTSLLDFADLVNENVKDIPESVALLCTQGSADPVCPAVLTKCLFDRLPNRNKHYEEIEELRHEPFSGAGSEQLFQTLDDWVGSLSMLTSQQEKAPT